MNQIRRFMYGRYGFDQYSSTLVFISLILSVIATFTRFTPLFFISYVPLVYAIYRILSKNIAKRSHENLVFFNLVTSIRNKFKNFKLVLVGTKTHKYYRCDRCKQIIRVPRGKGKISITCPKCKAEFVRRT